MGIIGSLIIHSLFLFLSFYIHIGEKQIEEGRLIEVSLVSIPEKPRKPEVITIQKSIRGPIIPSVKNEVPSLKFKPKRVIFEELPGKKGPDKEISSPWKPVKPKLDIANTYGEILVGQKTEEGIGSSEDKGESGGKGGPFSLEITGEVARRAILYQSGFKIPEWLERKGISLEGRFKFFVLADGSVDRVVIEHSFGYKELDSLAMDSILRWRFASLKGGTYEEWGIARIKIKLK